MHRHVFSGKKRNLITCDFPGCGNSVFVDGNRCGIARRKAETDHYFMRDGTEDFCPDHAKRDEEPVETSFGCPHCGGHIKVSG